VVKKKTGLGLRKDTAVERLNIHLYFAKIPSS
jgi:hypothetical protein